MVRYATYSRRGMSLIQMLVALSVVAILAAIFIPAINGVIERSHTVKCAGNMRQVGMAFLLYRSDHNGFFPPGRIAWREDLGDTSMRDFGVHLVDRGYLPERLYCPSMRLQNTAAARERYPDEERRLKQLGSYGINAFLLGTTLEAMPGPHWDGVFGQSRYPYPGDSMMLFIGEGTCSTAQNAWFHTRTALNGYGVGIRMIAPRDHGNMRLNFMFLDGRIELIAPEIDSAGNFDWSKHFNQHGRDGRYVQMRNLPNEPNLLE